MGKTKSRSRCVSLAKGQNYSWAAEPSSLSNSSTVGRLPCSFSGRLSASGTRKCQSVCVIFERIFGNDLVLGLAEDKADTGLVVGMAQQVVDRGEVEIHLAGELGLEGASLKLDRPRKHRSLR